MSPTDQAKIHDSDATNDTAARMLAAERAALEAEARALQTLNRELQRHRTTAEKSLAEARALLSRREAALEDERSRAVSLEHALVQARMELEDLLERRRLGSARFPATETRRKRKRPKWPASRPVSAKRKCGAQRPTGKQSMAGNPAKRTPLRKQPRNRRT